MTFYDCLKPLSIGFLILSSPAYADLSGLGGAVGSATDSVTDTVSSVASGPGASVSTSVNAGVPGVAEVDLCAEASVNSETGGGCGAGQARSRNPAKIPASELSSQSLKGLVVLGAAGKLVGHVKRASVQDQQVRWILVEMPNKRQVQLINAIKSVGRDGVQIGLTRNTVQSRLKGNFTRLRVACKSSQETQQNIRDLNSCWSGT